MGRRRPVEGELLELAYKLLSLLRDLFSVLGRVVCFVFSVLRFNVLVLPVIFATVQRLQVLLMYEL
jgi:hypothetical protein